MSELTTPFYKTTFFKRIILYGAILGIAYELKSFANLFLLLFFVTYILNELCKFIHVQISKLIKVPEEWVIFGTYLVLISLIVFEGVHYTPIIIEQAKSLAQSIDVSKDLDVTLHTYLTNILGSINPSLKNIFELYDVNLAEKVNTFSASIVTFSYDFLKGIGIWIFNIFLLIILSLFFLVEKNKIKKFANSFKGSNINFVYDELHPAIRRFYKSFGSMIQAQFIISLINTALTTIALFCLGYKNLLTLALMVFLFGLIPVAGAILSSIPLALIGFKMAGITYVLYIVILVLAIHILEAYILNPRIFSTLTHLPVFITLVVLLISEHVFGPWGLVYGLPFFVFLIDSAKPVVSEEVPQENASNKPKRAKAKNPS